MLQKDLKKKNELYGLKYNAIHCLETGCAKPNEDEKKLYIMNLNVFVSFVSFSLHLFSFKFINLLEKI